MILLRLAKTEDLSAIMQIIQEARAFLGKQGFDQWQHAYPAESDILSDLTKGLGYVLTSAGNIAGYCAVITGEEPAYTKIQGGVWSNASKDYVTVHRIAISDRYRGLGLSHKMWAQIYKIMGNRGYSDFRVDTHPENLIMQKMLAREGFKKRGIVQFEGERIAYQKELGL